MIARLLALAAAVTVAVAPAPSADALAAKKKPERVRACKTKAAAMKAAKQPKRKRRCRPQARHLRKTPAGRPATTPTSTAPFAPAAPPAAPFAPAPGAPSPSQQPAPPADPTCGPSRHLGAIAEDADGFRLRLTRTCVPSGQITVNWQNTDASEHDLWAMPLGDTAGTVQRIVTAALTTETPVFGTVTLTPGRWALFCSLEGHGAMQAIVTVTP